MSIIKKTFAVLLACLLLAGAMPLGALAESDAGMSTETSEDWDEYDKSYYDPADYEDGEAAPSGVFTPFADGADPVHINAEPEEEPNREPVEVPSGDCDYSLRQQRLRHDKRKRQPHSLRRVRAHRQGRNLCHSGFGIENLGTAA